MQREQRLKELRVFAEEIRVATLKELKAIGFGHVGGSMSVVEALAVLYGQVMRVDPQNPRWEERDWMVMSKGHAGPAAYATLALKGYFPEEELATINLPHTNLPSHTDRLKTPGIDLTTGSLGQGVSTAVGAALGNRLDGRDNHVFVFVGDGECDEGQVWEGAQFAAHYGLDHLIFLIDSNKYQLDGAVDDVMRHGDLAAKFAAFGLATQSIDGHDLAAIWDAIDRAYATKGQPSCIVLNTVKGRGCSFADGTGAHSSQVAPEVWDEAIAHAEERLAQARAQL